MPEGAICEREHKVKHMNQRSAMRAVLLAGIAGSFAVAGPAYAQDSQNGAADILAEPTLDEDSRIVVTGSRIRNRDYESNSPIVTIDEGLLENSSTAALESNLNKLPQFVPADVPTAGGDIQPTATNTPGAATVSLRGIGANRNLVLLDGRRATPGNATGVVDINTIPAAAIERVEVISGGASATYGADAVAGVTNFIIRRNFEGLELDGQVGITQEGDGFEYQLSGIMGADFDDGRGNVSLAMSINTREASFRRDRSWYRDLWADPSTTNGSQFFIENAGINFNDPTNQPNYGLVFPGANPPIPGFTTVYANTDGSAFTNSFPARGGVPNFNSGRTDGSDYLIDDSGALTQTGLFNYLILPLTRYNAFARGNYEISDNIGVFGQALFSKVETSTVQEPGPIFAGWAALIDPTIQDAGEIPSDLQTLLDSRPNPDAPFTLNTLLPANRETFTDVTTYTLIAGLEGSIPDTDWTWEAFVNHGESSTFALQTGIYSLERTRAVLGAPNFGRGFVGQGNAAFGGFGASRATCTSGLNFFRLSPEEISDDCLEAISADLKNRSTIRQTIAEANLTGTLFDNWAGPVGFALGASYRELDYEFLNDTITTQGRSFNDQALGIYPSGNSVGFYDVHELYGELLIPLLRDTVVNSFNLELGGRMSKYSTTGTSYTYKILGDLEVSDWLRFRGGFNRAERAPNIAELFLAPQQTFGGNAVGDPCSLLNPTSFSANPAANSNAANVEATCRVLMEQSGDPTADEQYYAGVQSSATGGFAFPTTVGNPNLTPETADTWTAGVVISPIFGGSISRARLTVDWFSIRVTDAIAEQTVGIALQQCFDPALNPLIGTDPVAAANTLFCQNVPRNTNGGLGNVQRTFVNNGRFKVSGIDVAADLGIDAGPGTINFNVIANYLLDFKSAPLPTLPEIDYVGTLGNGENGLNTGAYEYRVLTTVGYSVGPATIGLQWQHLPSIEDGGEAQFGSTPTTGYPSYNLFHLNTSYQVNDTVGIRFGVENLLNKAPPVGIVNTAATQPAVDGNLPGGQFNDLFYDINGRRFYLGAKIQF